MRAGQKTGFARRLRCAPTDAERVLWYRLRNRALIGAKFRRQHPIGPYVVDFVCVEARLVVELDGGQHAGCADDARRSALLRSLGYRVLRFWNHEVFEEREAVLEAIVAFLQATSPQPLSRKRERG